MTIKNKRIIGIKLGSSVCCVSRIYSLCNTELPLSKQWSSCLYRMVPTYGTNRTCYVYVWGGWGSL